jgi:hypothetical protein
MEPRPEYRVWEGLRLRLWYGDVGGRPAVIGVELWGVEPKQPAWPHQVDPEVAAMQGWDALKDTPVTAEAVRLPLGRLLRQHVAEGQARGEVARKGLARLGIPKAKRRDVAAYLKQFGPLKPGRPPLPEEFFRMVAEIWREAAAAGGHPTKAVQYRLSQVLGRDVPPSTARRWVMEARNRDRKFLPPASARAASPARQKR